MINLSFLEQYGPLGNGLKGNMKMEHCSPDFITDMGSKLINNKETVTTPRIGIPPSVTINNDELVYLPTESICRLTWDLDLNAYFISGNGYTVISQNRISIPTDSFVQIDPCGTGDIKEIKLSETSVAVVVTSSNVSFYDQNGEELNAEMRRAGYSYPRYDVIIRYDTKQIKVVKGPEN